MYLKYNNFLAKWICLVLAVIPLLEGVFVEPFWQPKINLGIDTFPWIQMAILIFLIFASYRHKLKFEITSTFILLVVLVYSCISMSPRYNNIAYMICVLLSFFLVALNWDEKQVYTRVSNFMLCLALLSIAVMLVRLKMYNFDLIRARSGANIYGANAVFNLYLLFFTHHILVIKDRNKDKLHFLLMAIVAFVFISKTAIIIILVLFVFHQLFFMKVHLSGVVKVLGLFLIGISAIYFILFHTGLGEVVLFRFGAERIANEGVLSSITNMISVQQEHQRGVLWRDAITLIETYPLFGIGIGLYSEFGSQTSAHNLILNNFAEFGLLIGSLINFSFIVPFYLIIKLNLPVSRKGFAIIVYFFFFIQAVLAGQKIIQSSGYISAFFLLFFFALLYQVSQLKKLQ